MNDIRTDLAAEDQASNRHEKRLARAFGSSMIWNIANNLATNCVTLFVFIFLTYKLDAAVFGLFALGVIIVDYFNFQARSACLDAAVQRRAFTPHEMDTVFWAMMGVTVCVIIVCAFAGSWLAQANNQPSLTYMMPVLALTLLPVPLSVPPNAVMMRDHDFKGGAIRGIISAIVGGAVALAVVFSPISEWALVAQRGTQVTVSAVIMALRVRWWPGFHFSPPLAASYLKDAGRIFAAQAIASSNMRVLDLVVAFGFGAAAVGFMRIASRFVDILYGTFIAPISSLWVVLLSEGTQTKGDRDMLYRRLTQMSALIALPIFGGLALTSKDVIAVTLSPDFAPTASILVILCAVGLFSPLTYFRNAALVAVKRLNLLIAYSVLDIIIVIGASLWLTKFSVEAVVSSLLVLECVRLILTVPVLLKDMHTKAIGLFLAALPAYAACIVMVGAVWLVDIQSAGFDPWLRLGLKIAAGGFAYVAYLLIFHRKWSMTAINMLRPNGQPARAPDAVTVSA
ncbi:MAG: oligosaccharide flippase family protein [Hyphomonas sp.]|uniref:oligosaccharide flippase family protein n=1 Tax=Hyphomonas sp. TaxID=87 RepID=UPI001797F49F|nr:oligosaccharide flippase family protein [Hyphomonas sp.]MBA3067989.1 oligosaccharide flippase family protein [Hyphomonas sp.]MBU3920409.1 oligosaccharide flippase family protein [Alphaproteobacteria bacterium]MBU4061327.1 oligosaccharide flippase family protein [Alphaproteobacteria bacterium]MBU4162580.1 oligosaccharide flippase family protein [Alphaproteobacteria bacterium]